MAEGYPDVCMVFKAGGAYQGKQGPNYAPGVSAEASRSRALWMGTVVIPPGGRTKAHLHEAHESAVYVLRGTIRVYHGTGLEAEPLTSNTGDYVFIPAGVPHVAVNASQDEEAVAILARTDPSEQESVVLLPELESLVPA
ncbi:MAG TPA: cupin domain-containing protein [Dehalococcoidia bacterium]|nr:cupin domain-containing protein [Dehalococcoidia bacterium]